MEAVITSPIHDKSGNYSTDSWFTAFLKILEECGNGITNGLSSLCEYLIGVAKLILKALLLGSILCAAWTWYQTGAPNPEAKILVISCLMGILAANFGEASLGLRDVFTGAKVPMALAVILWTLPNPLIISAAQHLAMR